MRRCSPTGVKDANKGFGVPHFLHWDEFIEPFSAEHNWLAHSVSIQRGATRRSTSLKQCFAPAHDGRHLIPGIATQTLRQHLLKNG